MTENFEKKVNVQKLVKPYCKANDKSAWWQLANTLIPLLFIWAASYKALETSLWLSFAFSALGALFLVRVFIIMHDCGHGSFFTKRKLRDVVGTITGILTFTPYRQWTAEHAAHHQHSGDLDFRGRGDVWTMTLEEYKKAGFWERVGYRLYRNPIVTFGIGPIYLFQFRHRISIKSDKAREKNNLYLTNICLALMFVGLGMWLGFKEVFIVHAPMTIGAQLIGCLLFYVQHQYEDVYWQKGEQWQYNKAALEGCSYLKLPKALQWFTGNIGFHHIHHLNHRVPNYKLETCYEENAIFQNPTILTIKDMIPCINMKVYDERSARMLTWSGVRKKLRTAQPIIEADLVRQFD